MTRRKKMVVGIVGALLVLASLLAGGWYYASEQAEVAAYVLQVHGTQRSATRFQEKVATMDLRQVRELKNWIDQSWIRRHKLHNDLEVLNNRLSES